MANAFSAVVHRPPPTFIVSVPPHSANKALHSGGAQTFPTKNTFTPVITTGLSPLVLEWIPSPQWCPPLVPTPFSPVVPIDSHGRFLAGRAVFWTHQCITAMNLLFQVCQAMSISSTMRDSQSIASSSSFSASKLVSAYPHTVAACVSCVPACEPCAVYLV